MEYQALYRKYRPKKFSDVVDQESILKILTNSLKEGHISHAYLFSGPRGTGKTTVAKLVAKTVNCLNLQPDFSICLECENCKDILNNSSDIIEIDAASNNGIDEIRELKSKINLIPNKLKYKVYIIDEVHMLSISAFNALLKTLEEPPSHVIFILATTEFYKVPETIVSRCLCLNFTRIKDSSIAKRLREISDLEHIDIEDEALEEIAKYSNGGMRDALGMLDKLASYSLTKITKQDFLKINGLISKEDMDSFIKNILNKENKLVLNKIEEFNELGYDFAKILENLMQEARDLMIDYYENKKNNLNPKELYKLILCFNETYNLLKEAMNRKIIMEVNLLKFMNFSNQEASDVKEEKKISQEITVKPLDKSEKNLGNIPELKKYELNLEIKRVRIDNTFAKASKLLKKAVVTDWSKINDYLIDQDYSYVAGLLKDLTVGVVSDENMILCAKINALIEDVYNNFSKITDLIKLITGKEYRIVILNNQEFDLEVNNYKSHMNDLNYYVYKEEDKPLIISNSEIEKKDKLGYTELEEKALSVFGEKIVEIE